MTPYFKVGVAAAVAAVLGTNSVWAQDKTDASNLDEIVENSGAALWLHGHTHVSQDYWIGSTRVVCNPRGYAGYELNPDFDPNLVVAV